MFGFYYRAVQMGDISEIAWKYFTCTIPVVATMGRSQLCLKKLTKKWLISAPIGSVLGSHLHRQVIAALIYILEAASLVGFLLTKPTWFLIIMSGKCALLNSTKKVFSSCHNSLWFCVLPSDGKVRRDAYEIYRSENRRKRQTWSWGERGAAFGVGAG